MSDTHTHTQIHMCQYISMDIRIDIENWLCECVCVCAIGSMVIIMFNLTIPLIISIVSGIFLFLAHMCSFSHWMSVVLYCIDGQPQDRGCKCDSTGYSFGIFIMVITPRSLFLFYSPNWGYLNVFVAVRAFISF